MERQHYQINQLVFRYMKSSVVDPNPKESESFGWIRIQKKNSDSDPDTVVE
jgi:hypothetical protein